MKIEPRRRNRCPGTDSEVWELVEKREEGALGSVSPSPVCPIHHYSALLEILNGVGCVSESTRSGDFRCDVTETTKVWWNLSRVPKDLHSPDPTRIHTIQEIPIVVPHLGPVHHISQASPTLEGTNTRYQALGSTG